MTDLTEKHCVPCEGGVPALTPERIQELLKDCPEWKLDEKGAQIERVYRFKNFYKTMAFVNAVAFIANQEGHHPDMQVGYDYARLNYTTHAIGGLTDNDFICAAKIDCLSAK